MHPTVVIYTDGGCGRMTKIGGWSAILTHRDNKGIMHERELCGGQLDTTNNRMEITAVLEALRALKTSCNVTIYSDSQYVVNSIGGWIDGQPNRHDRGWLVGWKYYGWTRKEGELKNVDLWQLIDIEVRRHKSVTAAWVQGHNGHEYNERCDLLATKAIEKLYNECATKRNGLPPHGAGHSAISNGGSPPGLSDSVQSCGSRADGGQ